VKFVKHLNPVLAQAGRQKQKKASFNLKLTNVNAVEVT